MKTGNNEWKRAIGLTFALLVLGVVVLFYCDWRGTFADTAYVCRKSLWALPVFAVLLSLFYYFEGRGLTNREFMDRLFWGTKENTLDNAQGRSQNDTANGAQNTSVDSTPDKVAITSGQMRKSYLDYARILAAVCVILTHACSMQRGEDVAAWRTNLLTICAGLGLVCNPLYVMISGSLLISSDKEESLASFYFRRFIKVVIPMVVYYAIFLCISGQMSFLPPENLGKGFLQILKGESDIVPHYWLIYMLIALYIAAPFVRKIMRKLNDRQIMVCFWLILILESALTLLPLAGVQMNFVLKLMAWEGVFVLGYIVTEKRSKAMEVAVLILGVLSAIIISAVLLRDYSLLDYVCNTSPVMVVFAGAVIILLSKISKIGIGRNKAAKKQENGSMMSKSVGTAVRVLSKYSYSIILVHWYGLFVVTWGKIGLQPLRFGCIGGIVLTVSVATLVCLVMGFVGDNTIVFAVQHIVKEIGNFIKKIKKKKVA